jgi:hypothetical protein
MSGTRKPKAAKPKAAKPNCSAADAQIAYDCGLYGLNEVEARAKLATLNDSELLEAYQRGKADHAFSIMQAIYQNAVGKGKEKLLIWLAENSLQRTVEAQTGNALIDAMSPEQRRARIRELTAKVAVNE